MRFRYVAIENDGREVSGLIEAPTMRDAIARISQDGRIPVSAKPADAPREVATNRGERKRLTEKKLPDFTRRLAQLCGAGVSIEKALEILARNGESTAPGMLREKLVQGGRFSTALEAYGAPFTPVYVALVRAGEVSGDLAGTFENLAASLERARQVREQLQSALIYPILLFAVSMAVFLLLMLFVVPRFEVLFADAQTELPFAAQLVIGAANWIESLWWAPLVVFIGGYFLLRATANDDVLAVRLDAMKLRIPIFGDLMLQSETARLARALGALLTSGAPAHQALTLAVQVLGNRSQRAAAMGVCERVRRGERISAAMSHEGLGQDDLLEIVEVGETAGALGLALSRAATMLEENLTRRLKAIVAMVEPCIILTLGVLIGGVVVSLFSAILSINDLAF